jgi:dihydrofolate reductase
MGRLRYTAIASLDGYVRDAAGGFEWAAPAPDVHAHVNAGEREVGTYLYGRRMYEVMSFWADPGKAASESPLLADYAAIWQSADKVVFSSLLDGPRTPRTRVERRFDPERVRAAVADAARDTSIGGPELTGHAFRSGLVDEVRLYLLPVTVGSGAQWAPADTRLTLTLREAQPFASGAVCLRYDVVR